MVKIKIMKKILLILLVSVLLIGCSENRVLIDELTNKGTKDSQLMYSEGKLFNGIGFDVYSNGKLKSEVNYKDGKKDGLHNSWNYNSQLWNERNYKDGKEDGLQRSWDEDGQLEYEGNYKDGKEDGLQKEWYEDGQFRFEKNYKDGKEDGLQISWEKMVN